MTPAEEERASIQDIADRLSITQFTFESALAVYSAARQHLRGFSLRQLEAASVYASCRLLGIPRTLKDVAAASGVRASRIARCYRRIVVDGDLTMPVQDPAAYLPDIAARAGLDAETSRRALGVLEAAKKRGVTVGKDPRGVAAAVLYEAYAELHLTPPHGVKQSVTQKVVADAAGVDELTLRNRSHQIRSLLGSG